MKTCMKYIVSVLTVSETRISGELSDMCLDSQSFIFSNRFIVVRAQGSRWSQKNQVVVASGGRTRHRHADRIRVIRKKSSSIEEELLWR